MSQNSTVRCYEFWGNTLIDLEAPTGLWKNSKYSILTGKGST